MVRKQGLGTFAKHPIDQELSTVRTIPEVLLMLGMMPDVKVLSFGAVLPPADVQRELQVPPGERVVLMKRLYCAGRAPVALVYVYLPLALKQHAMCHYHSERYTFSVTVPRRRLTSRSAFMEPDTPGRLKLVKS